MPHSDSSPEYWFELASDDEESARILVRESASSDIAAYHFHQALEKILKGNIARATADIPRIHDLERLFRKAQSLGIDVPEDAFDRVALIQAYYSDFRHPRGERIGSPDLARIVRAFDEAKTMLANG
jgi:HEPN domain-containing protein